MTQMYLPEQAIDRNIGRLVRYGIQKGLIPEREKNYSVNLLLDIFGKKDYTDYEMDENEKICLEEVLTALTDAACKNHLAEEGITGRDLFDTKLMNCILPRPAQFTENFWKKYEVSSAAATDYFYGFSQDSNYIRRDRIVKDMKWEVDSVYGKMDITINLSKPEKDPKAIAAAGKAVSSSYPKCLLCMENEGYAGSMTHPARQNHRIVPLTLGGEEWGFQYSPYVYYNEHCIVFNGRHIPMKIKKETFQRLFDFVKLFPHYFIGSNADLAIVGGSILSHDHFQGGNYTFAMAKADVVKKFSVQGFEDVDSGILKWPLSVIRLRCKDADRLTELGNLILNRWRSYTDEAAFIYAGTNGEPHNTITPIARFRNGSYELDLTLRNNITTEEYPLGVYHPHKKLHHIKKENIGLIEVMGLAVLPSRLKAEMELLADYILDGRDIRENETLLKHADWVEEFLPNYTDIQADNIMEILKAEIGRVFVEVLEDAGVYKCTAEGLDAFMRFTDTLNQGYV